jgi:hypothetical protein
MNREDKIKIAIEKGFIYDKATGKIYGLKGNEIKSTRSNGYISVVFYEDDIQHQILGHQFAWFYIHNKVADYIDHIDGNKTNNKIDNLRSVTHQKNMFNLTKAKGYYFSKHNKFIAQIMRSGKRIYLGSFNTEQEARQAYLDAKKIYHII